MKRSFSRDANNAGVALVVVLAILVLVGAIVVSMLNIAKTERQAASVYLASTETKQLSETAVGIVQAQINHATSQGNSSAWSSQPGMIRTYTSSGKFQQAYKLYSASSLTADVASKIGEDLPPADWASQKGIWIDLNAPVTTSGNRVFPIVNPDILDDAANVRPSGFSITNAPGATIQQQAPMPVRWLYVLEDGQIINPTRSGSTISVAGAGGSNPIVGRIAFWTDDDSCKVNLNTAGQGGYWDSPYFYTTEDRKLATSQPLNGEFQRYPGHPATTSLGAVFPNLSDESLLGSLVPRMQWGGSQQGLVDTFAMSQALHGGVLADAPLYSDPDEIAFRASYLSREPSSLLTRETIDHARFFLTTDSRSPEVNLFNLPRVSCWPLSVDENKRTVFDRLIAFVSSIGANPYYFQRESSLSPTVDADIERNKQLFNYLSYLTDQPIPGFGTKLADKFGIDRHQILTEIWDYIRCTNLFDSRLGAAQQFVTGGSPGASGYGYVAPLKNGDSRGFGRALTVSELAFIFICTADPVDTQTPANPLGMQGSNDPVTNKTLNGVALKTSPRSERRIQMLILPEFFSPSLGYIGLRPKYLRISIDGLKALKVDGQSLFTGNSATYRINDAQFNSFWHSRSLGGTLDFRAVFQNVMDPGLIDVGGSLSPYPFISNFVTVGVQFPGTGSPGTMPFETGPLTITVESSVDGASWTVAQTLHVSPPASSAIPIPNLVRTGTNATSGAGATDAVHWWAFSSASPAGGNSGGRLSSLTGDTGSYHFQGGFAQPIVPLGGTLFREAEKQTYHTDVVRTMAVSHGDFRLVQGLENVPAEAFSTVGNWNDTGVGKALIHTLSVGGQHPIFIPGGSEARRHYMTNLPIGPDTKPGAGGYVVPDFQASVPNSILQAVQNSGDFDNGLSYWPDGAYINKPDEGSVYTSGTSIPYYETTEKELVNSIGFFSPNRITSGPGMFGSLPTHVKRYENDPTNSAKYAWRTLLFRHQPGHPDAVSIDTDGLPSGSAPDHLLMDLFWMPTVEPYAISEPFATAGKVNMNYQIQPFTYIKRETGMYAVLMREKLAAVPTNAASTYKVSANISNTQGGNASLASVRTTIDVSQTLAQFDARFENPSGRIFLSPTELCDLWLVPSGETVSSTEHFWKTHSLTGDNMRERPYTRIIPRLTTKSNTYTVHYRVQRLRKNPSTPAGTWQEISNAVLGEYRGSTTIQRFIDLNNSSLMETDFVVNTADKPTLDGFYRWRVINMKQFAP